MGYREHIHTIVKVMVSDTFLLKLHTHIDQVGMMNIISQHLHPSIDDHPRQCMPTEMEMEMAVEVEVGAEVSYPEVKDDILDHLSRED
jgi:hypothetical protein